MANYLMSICLLRLPLLLFLARKTAAKLSQYILNDLEIESTILSPKIKHFNHTLCDVALKQDMNLASVVEVAIKVCLVFLQDTSLPTNTKMYLNVDFYESTHPAKSESK